MKLLRRHLALLGASVSLVAVGTASPAAAATTVSPGIGHSDTTDPVEDTLTICDLGDECFFGVEADGTGLISAIVHDVASGRIEQTGVSASGDVQLDLVNHGSAEIVAHANAHSATGIAQASASLIQAIHQNGGGTGEVTLSLSNNGSLLVDAGAHAVGDSAQAMARIASAVIQNGMSNNGRASVALTNDGSLSIIGNATATAEGLGHAVAFITQGLVQQALAADSAVLALHNDGDINLGVEAQAVASSAVASAELLVGIRQSANAGGDGHATASIVNDGTIDISVAAKATGDVQAKAFAGGTVATFWDPTFGLIGISQNADAGTAGAALASLSNSGTINISAVAVANAADAANARGAAGTAVLQHAHGSAADAILVNEGDINVLAKATAVASHPGGLGGKAVATATAHGIGQAAIATNKLPYVAPTGTTTGTITITDPYARNLVDRLNQLDRLRNSLTNSGAIDVTGPISTLGSGSITGTDTLGYLRPLGPANASLTNSGSIDLDVIAVATGGNLAHASALIDVATQVAWGTQPWVSMVNDGSIDVHAYASAVGNGFVVANVLDFGVRQTAVATGVETSLVHRLNYWDQYRRSVHPTGPTRLSFINNGTIDLTSFSRAVSLGGADGPPYDANPTTSAAWANGNHIGIKQMAAGTSVVANVVNVGTIRIDAAAVATGIDNAGAAVGGNAILQGGAALEGTEVCLILPESHPCEAVGIDTGPVSASVENTGTINISLNARAEAHDNAHAAADGLGITQGGSGRTVDFSVDNQGELNIDASAFAEAGVSAQASAVGIAAVGSSKIIGTTISDNFLNDGSIDIHASALASGAEAGTAFAVAMGHSMNIYWAALEASYVFENSGTISLEAVANAKGGRFAGGTAIAFGEQVGGFVPHGDVAFDNSGEMTVGAKMHAVADAETGFAGATAFAHGYFVGPVDIAAQVENSGSLQVNAHATAEGHSGWALATAEGVALAASSPVGTSSIAYGGLTGALDNAGTIEVLAAAKGIADDGTSKASTANAIGIELISASNTMKVTNSGAIDVAATVDSSAGSVEAVGIRAEGGAEEVSAAAEEAVLTITNDGGTIRARQSTDGGETWKRGLAIDVANAPNASVINLLGGESGGQIYGNIDVQDGDVINVSDGETLLDGIVNPECVGASDRVACGQGVLNIVEEGTLVLADPRYSGDPTMYDGPAQAYVETLEMDESGTLAFALEPDAGGAQDPGSYPQLFAATANLDGTLEARFAPRDGLFANEYSWDDLIVAGSVNGEFDRCVIGGAYAGSLLLDFFCSYDAQNNVSLALSRVAFDAVDGLNRNGSAVAGEIESIYDPDLTGGIVNLVGDLFLMGDAVDYNVALNQLSGSAYANYLQSFGSLGVHSNDLVDRATSCEVPGLAGSVLECRAGGPVHVWGQLDYQNRKADGDAEAGSYRSKRYAGLIGVDAALNGSAIVGISAGALSNHVRDHQFGDRIKADGYQLGAYGVYDPGAFYVKGVASYSWLDGDSSRSVNLVPFGGTFSSRLDGDPDVRMWTLGLHAGYRIPLGEASIVTPYLNVDYVDSRIKGFTERTAGGDEGAELSLSRGRSARSYVTGGVKWATRLGGVVPELNVGYRYRFGERRAKFTATEIGGEDAQFSIVSAAAKRGTFLAGLSVGGKVGPLDLRLAYEGEYNRDVTSHSGNLKLVLPLGGRKTTAAVSGCCATASAGSCFAPSAGTCAIATISTVAATAGGTGERG